ncbi:hypothetical protein H4R20_001511 [Coemansia guatemalensis]|uniref:glycerophosphodiester phosphodiesterase n=1 Tax=Coemansia guatemalensis TaxID=2761395 RepID=A0A9W8LVK4_9FUNG|nr:hypothetical protein H4R20_001511 [Coemansia guatemalensis]
MPEHSRGSYWQAGLENADWIEPDLGLTKDGHLVVNHNEWLGETTNIAEIPELAHLRTSRSWMDNGRLVNITAEWFIFDMTLEQVKKVRIRQDNRYPWRPKHFDDIFEVLTFEEYLQLMRNLTVDLGKPFGVIPELKSPKVYNQGRSYPRYFEDRAILTLNHYGWANITANVNRTAHSDLKLSPLGDLPKGTVLGPSAWQSFDLDTAEYLAQHTDTPVVALCEDLPWIFTPHGLDHLAGFAQIVSFWKDAFVAGAESLFRARNVTWDAQEIRRMGGFIEPQNLAREIHSRKMAFSPYTLYDSRQEMGYLCQTQKESNSLVACPRNRTEELLLFFSLGADYLFVENIPEVINLRTKFDSCSDM